MNDMKSFISYPKDDAEDDVEDDVGLLLVQKDKVRSMLKMLHMMLKNFGLILVYFLSRKVQSV